MAPVVTKTGGSLVNVSGTFFRAVIAGTPHGAIDGSISAGRFSRPGQKTLYMSAEPEGVAAAMQAHPLAEGQRREIWSLEVQAYGIADLREDGILDAIGMARSDVTGPWQDVVARGGEPRSWLVRDGIEAMGARGLIDPSRKAPGLWHLVLFDWNSAGFSHVRLIGLVEEAPASPTP